MLDVYKRQSYCAFQDRKRRPSAVFALGLLQNGSVFHGSKLRSCTNRKDRGTREAAWTWTMRVLNCGCQNLYAADMACGE